MPNLSIAYELEGLNPKDCNFVDEDKWAYSDHEPLSTVGAGPCLLVVVHHGSKGCLTHVKNTTPDRSVLFKKTCLTILDMLKVMNVVEQIEIWLGAGHAFNNFDKWTNKRIEGKTLPTWIETYLKHFKYKSFSLLDFRTIGFMDTKWNPGDIAYSPQTGKINLLTTIGGEGLNAQLVNNKGNKAKIRGKCRIN